MPEIKHNFTGGKMNKDLDERLVQNGEYRDALNIQVTTSEGSEIGTVQNILGNEFGCNNHPSPIPVGGTTVSSISDEKNDSLYWFVTNLSITEPKASASSIANSLSDISSIIESLPSYDPAPGSSYYTDYYVIKDVIMQKKNKEVLILLEKLVVKLKWMLVMKMVLKEWLKES